VKQSATWPSETMLLFTTNTKKDISLHRLRFSHFF
jgi:hypothetical protein